VSHVTASLPAHNRDNTRDESRTYKNDKTFKNDTKDYMSPKSIIGVHSNICETSNEGLGIDDQPIVVAESQNGATFLNELFASKATSWNRLFSRVGTPSLPKLPIL
jgi:hypothetical protein